MDNITLQPCSNELSSPSSCTTAVCLKISAASSAIIKLGLCACARYEYNLRVNSITGSRCSLRKLFCESYSRANIKKSSRKYCIFSPGTPTSFWCHASSSSTYIHSIGIQRNIFYRTLNTDTIQIIFLIHTSKERTVFLQWTK